MLYRPSQGQIKDGCILYENGKFYLFSMYHKDDSDRFNNIWLATSEDGVRFEDYGCVVEDFPDYIWAMKVYRGRDAYYMNSGSFTKEGRQSILKFWRSEDLLHWEYRSELDLLAPNHKEKNARLDCMNVLEHHGRYYGYATGQFGFLESEDGAHWKAYPSRIDYHPFPPYNTALGGFEIADFVELDGRFYLFCGGFGHLGMNGYGVYLYESDSPDGTFTPFLPFYRLNGTSKRWVNMWERCFKKNGEILCHNYTYDGYTYEKGAVYLPPIKKLTKNDHHLYLSWWNGNNKLYGDLCQQKDKLVAEAPSHDIFTESDGTCSLSEALAIPNGAIIECKLTLTENKFTKYSCGGIYLAENEASGSAILFDTYGTCEIVHVKEDHIQSVEDTVGFGSTSLYHLESGKTYDIRILSKHGFFEIYVNDRYLQTFNNAHTLNEYAKPITRIRAIAQRSGCTLSDLMIYHMKQ